MTDVCVFGDSIAKGVIFDGVKRKYELLKNSFVNLAGSALELAAKNYSKFGCTVKKGAETVFGHIGETKQSRFTLLEFGGNDSDFDWRSISENPDDVHLPKTTLEDFYRIYDGLIKDIKKEGGSPLLLNLPPVDPHKFFARFTDGLDKSAVLTWLGGSDEYIYRWHEMYSIETEQLARHNDVPLIDIRTPFLRMKNYTDYLCEDGIHPNESGHALISLTIERAAAAVL